MQGTVVIPAIYKYLIQCSKPPGPYCPFLCVISILPYLPTSSFTPHTSGVLDCTRAK